jgi:hypothetical protein
MHHKDTKVTKKQECRSAKAKIAQSWAGFYDSLCTLCLCGGNSFPSRNATRTSSLSTIFCVSTENAWFASLQGTSSTKSKAAEPVRAFATLRVSGDDLVPSEITKIIKIIPTKAYAKGEHYSGGPRSPGLIGRTGVWFFATDGVGPATILPITLRFLPGCCCLVRERPAHCPACNRFYNAGPYVPRSAASGTVRRTPKSHRFHVRPPICSR